MSRHFDRKISLAVSRRLAGTRVTPNQMTLMSVAIGLIGAPFFLSPRPPSSDRRHALPAPLDPRRLRRRARAPEVPGVALGRRLDFWGDNVVHMAVFEAMGLGLARSTGRHWPLVCGATAVPATAASAWFVYRRR